MLLTRGEGGKNQQKRMDGSNGQKEKNKRNN